MIVKFTRSGGLVRYIEAADIYGQPVSSGRIDLEITTPTGISHRLLVGEYDESGDVAVSWNRAYVMEGGKIVDTVRGQPVSASTAPALSNTVIGAPLVFRVPPTVRYVDTSKNTKRVRIRKKRSA